MRDYLIPERATDDDDCPVLPWFTGTAHRCPMDDGYAHICDMDAGHDGPCFCGCGNMKADQDDAYFCERCGESTANQARLCPVHRATR